MISLPGTPRQPVDLVIPARNERENVVAAIEALPEDVFRNVIVVDNGSTDGTAELARGAGAIVVSESERGYGAACLAGIAWIAGQPDPPLAVAFLDADLADDPSRLPELIDALDDDADMTVGCRAALAEPGALDPHQLFGNRLACRLIGYATGRHFRDLGPMRVVRWSSLQQLDMRDRTWGWMVEMAFKAARMNMVVKEIDVPYRKRRAGTSKISGSLIGSTRAGYKILATIAVLWWKAKLASHD